MKKKVILILTSLLIILIFCSFHDPKDNSEITFIAKIINEGELHPQDEKQWLYHSSLKVLISISNNSNDTIAYYLHSKNFLQNIFIDTSIIIPNPYITSGGRDRPARYTIAPHHTFEGEVSLMSEKIWNHC